MFIKQNRQFGISIWEGSNALSNDINFSTALAVLFKGTANATVLSSTEVVNGDSNKSSAGFTDH